MKTLNWNGTLDAALVGSTEIRLKIPVEYTIYLRELLSQHKAENESPRSMKLEVNLNEDFLNDWQTLLELRYPQNGSLKSVAECEATKSEPTDSKTIP